MILGNRILELRKQKQVTQEELAVELGVTAAAVSKWENGYTLPDVLMLCALADYFEVTTDELLGRAKAVKYAVIAAESVDLARRASDVAKQYGISCQGIYTDYEEAKRAAQESELVEYLVACYYHGFYEASPGLASLVSVAPTDEKILEDLRQVFDKYL